MSATTFDFVNSHGKAGFVLVSQILSAEIDDPHYGERLRVTAIHGREFIMEMDSAESAEAALHRLARAVRTHHGEVVA